LQEKLERVEKEIERCEQKKKELEAVMADPDAYHRGDAMRDVHTQYRDAGEQLMNLYHRWGKISEDLEKVRSAFDDGLERR
jgi:protein subunit release factor A